MGDKTSTKKTRKVKKGKVAQSLATEQKASLFPKIYRFITEWWKIIFVSLISGIIIIGITIQSLRLYSNLNTQAEIKAKRSSVEKELVFWKNKLNKYKDSRDIYFRIAALEYELGDKEAARVDLEKALEIDPNFKEGRKMEKQLNL